MMCALRIPCRRRPMTTMKDAGTTANPRAAGLSPDRLQTLDSFLQSRYIDAGKIPGALTLIYRRGEIAHYSPLGFAALAREPPVRPECAIHPIAPPPALPYATPPPTKVAPASRKPGIGELGRHGTLEEMV